MKEHSLAKGLYAADTDPVRDLSQYYCVEIEVRVGLVYQFKIWRHDSVFMSVLVREDSKFLSCIEVGARFNIKYYSRNMLYPYQKLDTEVRDISFQESGRIRGHYLVALEIREEAEQLKFNNIIAIKDSRFHGLKGPII
jgi:hypothetical protein